MWNMQSEKAIIIIEDDKDDQEILRDVFEELRTPCQLLFFDDCDKAYSHLLSLKEKPFLILCDINLPKINGIELKKKIECSEELRRKAIPFVFLTTSDNQGSVDDAYRHTNLQGYFKKGQSMKEMMETLKCILCYWELALQPSAN